MTAAEQNEFDQIETWNTEMAQAVISSVAGIDQCDGSRIELQNTLDSVRETLEAVYGDDFTNDLNEFLGIETVDPDDEDFDLDEA